MAPETLITLCFVLGYGCIAFEQQLKVHKSATALLTGVVAWILFIIFRNDKDVVSSLLLERLGNIAGVLFFLLGAMTIVELIDAHDGFTVITEKIRSGSNRKLLWLIGFITFFLSALLDNMTTAIVMVSLVRKLIADKRQRWIFAGMIIIAANAGGAWSPIGDVTTTMLWIGKQITAQNIVLKLFVPALVCLLVPLVFFTFMIRGMNSAPAAEKKREPRSTGTERRLVFVAGVLSLLAIPVFKTLTGLPPYMGMLFSLGLMWTLTEVLLRRKDESVKSTLSVARALRNTDIPTILFFLGILLCISAMEASGTLNSWSAFLTANFSSRSLQAIVIGLMSAVVDNVPLVAAVQGMYPLTIFATDHFFWEFIAYSAGTGGSILIIGSAAGVTAMGMENIDFFWYLRKMSLPALLGYFAGAGAYILLRAISG
jgi:Na+/H+ antiporter NhaD/arsenite permease-like protein